MLSAHVVAQLADLRIDIAHGLGLLLETGSGQIRISRSAILPRSSDTQPGRQHKIIFRASGGRQNRF